MTWKGRRSSNFQQETCTGAFRSPSVGVQSQRTSIRLLIPATWLGTISLSVPGLAEKRPSVILGDKIRVRIHNRPEGRWYAGYVHKVESRHVHLKFHSSFVAVRKQKFDIRFTLGRSPMRRMHQALNVAWNPDKLLFPTEEHIDEVDLRRPTTEEVTELKLFNRLLETNPMQKLAVASILCLPPGSLPFIVFGP